MPRKVLPKVYEKWIQLLVLSIIDSSTKKKFNLQSKKFAQNVIRGLLTLSVISLWYWHWQLLLATGVGIAWMWLSYGLSLGQYRSTWRKLATALRGYNLKFLLAVISGGLGGLFTYMTTAIWLDTENHWLAASSIAQGLMTLALLILLLWQIVQKKSDRDTTRFTTLLTDLTADDPLKRLIAIRQLIELAARHSLNPNERSQIYEYFHFMLAQPQEAQIQNALLDGVELLAKKNAPLPPLDSLITPIAIKESV